MGVLHPQLPGPVVHLLHKQLRDPRRFFRQGHGGVVAAGHAHPLQQVLHGDLLPGGQKNPAAAHGGGIVADGDHVVIGQGSPVDGLHHQQQGHDLGDAGRFQGLVLVFGVEHLSRLLLHQQRRLRLHRQLHPPGRTQRQQQHQHRQCPQQLFHGKPLPVFSSPYAPGGKKRTPPAGGVPRIPIWPFYPAARQRTATRACPPTVQVNRVSSQPESVMSSTAVGARVSSSAT